jgi:riboflavin kinase/FMN adenylyltransferase
MGMALISGWRDLTDAQKGASVALGNFDGVHLGHRRVIAEAAKGAGRLKAPLGAIRFSPHPARIMRPDSPPFLLMSPAQQARAMEALGVERLYDIPFDHALSQLSDEEFARIVLAEGLGVVHVAAGFDVSFGRGRGGDAEGLKRLGERYGFQVSIVGPVSAPDGTKYSSSAAREALRQGEPERAQAILGRPFAIEGAVERGSQLGRKLGFPTANIGLGDYVRPKLGIYATRTRLADGRRVPGVASLGVNPTLPLAEPRLEVWLLDFDEDLYGQLTETELVAYLRPERRFDDLDALTDQVMADAAEARAILMAEF